MEKSPLTYQFAQVPQHMSNAPLLNIDSINNPSAASANRPPLLRRVSQSDPHLDVPKPHFLHDTNYQSSIHNLLSGLFERSSPLGQNLTPLSEHQSNRIGGMDSTFEQQPISSRLDRNQSALELTSAASSNSLCAEANSADKPLRKVSSTAYNFAPADVSSNAQQQHHTSVLSYWWNSHIGGGLGGSSTHGSISKIPEEDQGLTMSIGQSSSCSEAPAAGGGALAAAQSSGLLDTTGAASAAVQTPVADTRPRNAHGGLVGILGRGFLGKPVLCNEADNYRYIMALDR